MKPPQRKLFRIAIIVASVAAGGWLSGVRLFAFPGKSMVPTVMPGDYFVGLVGAWKLRLPQRFDLVIFDVPPQSRYAESKIPWMKRVVGLPGERVRLSGDRLSIDGREMGNAFLHRNSAAGPPNEVDVVLKTDEYFVLGDNLDHSFDDSRTMGPINKSLLHGFVALVIPIGEAPPPKPLSITQP